MMLAGLRVFATERADGCGELRRCIARFELNELAVGAPLGCEVAIGRDAPALQDQNFVAGLFDIAQQVRRQQNVRRARIAHLADQLQHAIARRRVEAIGGFIEKDQTRAVDDSLRELGELLHAERVGAELAIARFAQANVKQRLVRAFERRIRRQA